MLHDILDDDHIQWHPTLIGHYTNFWPLLIWTLLPNTTFYLIVQGFHRTYATGAACQQRTLTPPDTWSCPNLGLACVLMSRPISPELVLSPDFWISNIPRYFSFAAYQQEEYRSCAWSLYIHIQTFPKALYFDLQCPKLLRGDKLLIFFPSYCKSGFLKPSEMSSLPDGRRIAFPMRISLFIFLI